MDEPLDPEMAAAVDRVAGPDPLAWHEMGVQAARRVEDDRFSPADPPPVADVAERSLEGPAGELQVRVYHGPADAPERGIVFAHGGGFVMGTLDSAEDLCRRLARRTDAVVVSVDYRLAPEHPFPAALEDVRAALSWAAGGSDLGVDPGRLHVAGTSAGGCLAAAVARLAAGEDDRALAGQHLLYPMLSAAWRDQPGRHPDGPLLAGADLAWFWRQYLPDAATATDPLAAPAAAGDLEGLAPATVVTAGHDPLDREGADYAGRLSAADVPVTHRHYPALSHGFLSFADEVAAADAAFDEVAAAVRAAESADED